MKKLWYILFAFLLTISFSQTFGQSHSTTTSTPRLFIKEKVNKGEVIEIVYEINKPGFVELHLFDSDRNKLWIKGKVSEQIGLAKIKVPTKPLETGKFYPFVLKYKGKDYESTIFF